MLMFQLQVKFAKVVMDRENPFRSRGFGFGRAAGFLDGELAADHVPPVGFASAEQAQQAVEKFDQEEFMVCCPGVWRHGRL